jgi:ATP-dependent protease Clp ATPase subunit
MNPYELVEPVGRLFWFQCATETEILTLGLKILSNMASSQSTSSFCLCGDVANKIFLHISRFTSRIPTITALSPLTTSDLMRVLTDVRGSLAKQYEALFGYSGVEIRFTTPALREICEMAVKRGMGARGLRGIMEGLLLESMYDVPYVFYLSLTSALWAVGLIVSF